MTVHQLNGCLLLRGQILRLVAGLFRFRQHGLISTECFLSLGQRGLRFRQFLPAGLQLCLAVFLLLLRFIQKSGLAGQFLLCAGQLGKQFLAARLFAGQFCLAFIQLLLKRSDGRKALLIFLRQPVNLSVQAVNGLFKLIDLFIPGNILFHLSANLCQLVLKLSGSLVGRGQLSGKILDLLIAFFQLRRLFFQLGRGIRKIFSGLLQFLLNSQQLTGAGSRLCLHLLVQPLHLAAQIAYLRQKRVPLILNLIKRSLHRAQRSAQRDRRHHGNHCQRRHHRQCLFHG